MSGRVLVSGAARSDSDTNEANSPATPNGSFADAQTVTNPVGLGGYTNRPGEGRRGRSFSSGDISDIYAVDLTKGQDLTLTVADPASADLDLYLFPRSCEAGSCGTNECSFNTAFGYAQRSARANTNTDTESLTVDTAGSYYVEVCAFAGASNYSLTMGQGTSTASAPATPSEAGMDADFVAGGIVVRFADRASKSATAAAGPYARAHALSMRHVAGGRGGPMLMSMRGGDRTATLSRLGVPTDSPKRRYYARQGAKALAKWDTLQAAAAIEARPDVVYAEPNYRVEAFKTPSDGLYARQWHYPAIGLPQAWDRTTGDPGVIVAVIDSGIRPGHPDLASELTGTGYDLISDSTVSGDGDGIDPDPTDPGRPRTNVFHGTHVAGTVGARSDDTANSIAGVAWGAQLMPVRALGPAGGTSFDVAQAIRYAAGLDNAANATPNQAADIINLSLGSSQQSEAQTRAIADARNAGVTIVAAAGNDNTSSPTYPAADTGVIGVSAVDINGDKATYSNFGDYVDVAAPGGGSTGDVDGDGNPDKVLSTHWDGANNDPIYSYLQGTSMAAPHVAGVIALMKALDPDLTPSEIDGLLTNGRITDDIGPNGRDDQFGYGRINAAKAVAEAGNSSSSPLLLSTPSALNLGTRQQQTELQVSNGGDNSLEEVDVATAASPSWLTVTEANVNAEGVGTYTVAVDRSNLNPGSYTATLEVSASNASTITVSVVMQVFNGDAQAEAGRHFFLLIDDSTGKAVQQDVVDPNSGAYDYSFEDVKAGDYRIITGTDFDNDGFVCDGGEACGAYKSLDTVTTVTVDADKTGLDFDTGFRIDIEASATGSGASDRSGYRRPGPKRSARP